MKDNVNIIFLGDIVGRQGRRVVENYITSLGENKPDFLIANVENASHGFGLTKKNHDELSRMGIDVFTSGNHIWDKREIFDYIAESDRLIRPLNYPKNTPGVGYRIIEKNGIKLGVINVLGRTFMNLTDSPWEILEETVKKIKEETPLIFVDVHAEATAEKLCMARFCDELGVSVLVGTHTHILTADDRIFENGLGYITDAGYCGDTSGIIGMNYEQSIRRMISLLPERLDVSVSDDLQINGVELSVNVLTGKTETIKRIDLKYKDTEGNIIMKGK